MSFPILIPLILFPILILILFPIVIPIILFPILIPMLLPIIILITVSYPIQFPEFSLHIPICLSKYTHSDRKSLTIIIISFTPIPSRGQLYNMYVYLLLPRRFASMMFNKLTASKLRAREHPQPKQISKYLISHSQANLQYLRALSPYAPPFCHTTGDLDNGSGSAMAC